MKMVLFDFFFLVLLLLHVQLNNALPTLRDMSQQCAGPHHRKSQYCGTVPAGCEAAQGTYPCEFITTVQRFELNCPVHDLVDPYVRILCAKRASTFLVTMLRLITHDRTKRSCSLIQEKPGVTCFMKEFVGVSLSEAKNDSITEDDIFFVCTADSPHITTWTHQGVSQVKKWIRNDTFYEDPYQPSVMQNSGVGVYFENIAHLDFDKTDFVCEFVLSVEDNDLEYGYLAKDQAPGDDPIVEPPKAKLNITLKNPLQVKMVQGFVKRSETNSEILDVIMKTQPPGTDPGMDTSDFKFKVIDKELKLGELELVNPLFNHTEHLRTDTMEDEQLHKEYWDPLFEACRLKNETCYLSDEDEECWREEREQCQLLVNFRFSKDFKELRVRMIVEDWSWGGFAFSLDRFMMDDVGFYCLNINDTATVSAQIHLDHVSLIGNDTRLKELIKSPKTMVQKKELKAYCEWDMPTQFEVDTGPVDANKTLKVDLLKIDYNVMVGVGRVLQERVSYHQRKIILPKPFSKTAYLRTTSSHNNASIVHPTFFTLVTCTLIFITTFL